MAIDVWTSRFHVPAVRDLVLVAIGGFLLIYHGPAAISALAQEGDSVAPLAALGTSFTYQGKLEQGSVPANGLREFEFVLWDSAAGGNALGSQPATLDVRNGIFDAQLDFGAAFNIGEKRWLEVKVKVVNGNAGLESLGRQELTATPFAHFASNVPWTGISGVPADIADGDQDTTYTAGIGLNLVGAQFQAAFAGDGNANTVARSDHDHFGQSWSGSEAVIPGLYVNNAGTSSAIAGQTGSGSGYLGFRNAIGVVGSIGAGICSAISLDATRAGVFGSACSQSVADGVRGYSITGAGVHGESITGGGAATIGVLGVAGAEPPVRPQNTGVYAYASGTDSTGVYGRANGLNAVAVKGVAPTSQEFAGRFFGKVEVNGVFTNPSDVRLKRDVTPIAYGLEQVLALKPVSYVMLDDPDGQTRLGLVAQDVQPVLPELVHGGGEEGMLSLAYTELTPVLIRAIQEQQSEIDSLRAGPLSTRGRPDQPASWLLLSVAVLALLTSAAAIAIQLRPRTN
ncbi:hypothetical protein AYO38_05500 [bacterium SCGC AG-212-C10]|nr:hypothetical protein AYO38_05500 [bacterium SCGC AG-212-C10]